MRPWGLGSVCSKWKHIGRDRHEATVLKQQYCRLSVSTSVAGSHVQSRGSERLYANEDGLLHSPQKYHFMYVETLKSLLARLLTDGKAAQTPEVIGNKYNKQQYWCSADELVNRRSPDSLRGSGIGWMSFPCLLDNQIKAIFSNDQHPVALHPFLCWSSR